jgi:anaerobic selenocysteine-containing dehydrogenase
MTPHASLLGTKPSANAQNVSTVCVLCSHNCGLKVDVQDNVITAVRGDPDNPNTKGYTCNKARAIPNYVQHRQRVTHPCASVPTVCSSRSAGIRRSRKSPNA